MTHSVTRESVASTELWAALERQQQEAEQRWWEHSLAEQALSEAFDRPGVSDSEVSKAKLRVNLAKAKADQARELYMAFVKVWSVMDGLRVANHRAEAFDAAVNAAVKGCEQVA